LEILLRDVDGAQMVGAAADGFAARQMIAALAPDVVLLDIKMPGLSGLELLESLDGGAAPIVIFVTAFDRFAIDAFDRAAFDYLLKPVEPQRLVAALDRAREALGVRAAAGRVPELEALVESLREDAKDEETGPAREIWIQERGGRVCVPVAAIDWVAAERDYVRIHAGARSFLVRQPIGDLAARLDARLFVRVHRSSLVRAERIVRLRNAGGRGWVVLSTGAEIPVSRRYMPALKDLTSIVMSRSADG
jgi:DNA-binding LytR/AlgR family response regulator